MSRSGRISGRRFCSQLREFGHFVPFPKAGQASRLARIPAEAASCQAIEAHIRRLFRRENIGAILVEPIQVRGGINIPPPDFLPMLRRLCDEHQALLILDEIYTGFGRTGKWFACEHSGTVPDVICLGKALTGGFPLSACVGRADLMDAAWPPSSGEAIHTSTFLGHPVGCAMALAQIKEIKAQKLVQRSAELGSSCSLPSRSSQPRTSTFDLREPRPGIVGRRGGSLAGRLPGHRGRAEDGQSAAPARVHFPARRRARECHRLHSAADDLESQLREAVNALGEELHRCKVT